MLNNKILNAFYMANRPFIFGLFSVFVVTTASYRVVFWWPNSGSFPSRTISASLVTITLVTCAFHLRFLVLTYRITNPNFLCVCLSILYCISCNCSENLPFCYSNLSFGYNVVTLYLAP